MGKRILFVAYYYPPAAGQALPGSQRIVKFVRYMSRMDKFVLTVRPECYPSYYTLDHPVGVPVYDEQVIRTTVYDFFGFLLRLKNFLLFRKSGADCPKNQVDNGEQEESTGKCEHRTSSFFQRIKDVVSEILRYPDNANGWIVAAVREGRRIIVREKIDILFATGKPWSALIAAYCLKKRNVQLVVDFRDPWVNNPFEKDLSRARKVLDGYLERKVVRRADKILLNTEYLRNEFCRRYPEEQSHKFVTVTNGFDAYDFRGKSGWPKKETGLGEQEAIIVTHAGLLYGLRDPVAVLKAMNLFYQTCCQGTGRHDILFRQIGGVHLDYRPEDFISTPGPVGKCFEYIGPVPYDQCLGYLSQTDILLIIQPDTKTQIPSKLFEYIFLNKPILTIAPLDGALAVMVHRYGFGKVYEPQDIEGIAEYFRVMAEEKEKNGALDCAYPERDRFDIKNITRAVEDLLLESEGTDGKDC